MKNEGGSFRKRIGRELEAVGGSGSVLGTVFLLTTWKSASRSLSESCRTWTTQLLFFLSIVSESCSRYVDVCLLYRGPDASKSENARAVARAVSGNIYIHYALLFHLVAGDLVFGWDVT